MITKYSHFSLILQLVFTSSPNVLMTELKVLQECARSLDDLDVLLRRGQGWNKGHFLLICLTFYVQNVQRNNGSNVYFSLAIW